MTFCTKSTPDPTYTLDRFSKNRDKEEEEENEQH